MLGRRPPALRPASSATANMLSESGARVNPVFIALYSSVIWRKIGSAIIAPPSVTFCSSCPEIPAVKCGNLNRPGSSKRRLPRPLAPHEPVGEQRERDRSDRDQQADELAAFLPDENAEDEAAHADHREDRADARRSAAALCRRRRGRA